MTYHVFTNDVGPNGYSCFAHIGAANDADALRKAVARVQGFAPCKVLAIPEAEVSHAFQPGSGRDPGGLKPVAGIFSAYGAHVRTEP